MTTELNEYLMATGGISAPRLIYSATEWTRVDDVDYYVQRLADSLGPKYHWIGHYKDGELIGEWTFNHVTNLVKYRPKK